MRGLAFAVALALSEPIAFTQGESKGVNFTDTGGNGVPVVLMHAATGSVLSWEHQTPTFVKAGYRVIAFDRRGWEELQSILTRRQARPLTI